MGAKPDEFAQAGIYIRFERALIFAAHGGIQAIRCHHNIVIMAVVFGRFKLRLKLQVHAQFPRPRLQDDQQLLAPDARKAVPARHRAHAALHYGNIIPIREMILDRPRADRIVSGHIRQRVIRQHDAPTKGIVGLVPFQHSHIMQRIAQFHRDREIQPRRATAEAKNLHACSFWLFRVMCQRCIPGKQFQA